MSDASEGTAGSGCDEAFMVAAGHRLASHSQACCRP